MYLKIVWGADSAKVVQCDRVSVHPYNEFDGDKRLSVVAETDSGDTTYEYDKATGWGVYVLNESGKTIDRYH